MSSGAGTPPDQQPTTPPALLAAARVRAAHPESPNDYLTRIVAAAPRITLEHPAAACLIQHFKNHTAEPETRKSA